MMVDVVIGTARLAGQTPGRVDPNFNTASLGLLGNVNAVAAQPDGKVLVAGGRKGVSRLNADGSADLGFVADLNGSGLVYTLAMQTNGKTLIGGYFSQVNGVAHGHLARLNADGSLDATFNPSVDAYVESMAVQADGKILIGGKFSQVNGATRNNLARLNADGSLDAAFNPSIDGNGYVFTVDSLAVQSNGKILLGGNFFQVNGVARTNIARLNADGTLDASFTTTAPGFFVTSLAVQPDGRIVMGGDFTQVNGMSRSHIARLNADGSVDAGFGASAGGGGYVICLALQPDGGIVLGGLFTQVDGVARSNLARLNADGSLDAGFGVSANSYVKGLGLRSDGTIVLGGQFTQVGGVGRNGVARLNANGSLDTGFLPDVAFGPNATVDTLAVQADGKILSGGYFTQINGVTQSYLARFNADGGLDASFGANADNYVRSIDVLLNGKIVLDGNFNKINGVSCANIARLNADGTLDPGFANPDAIVSGGYVSCHAVQPDGKILLGGAFFPINGVSSIAGVVRLNADGSLDPGFTVRPVTSSDGGFGIINVLAVQTDGKIVLGGDFARVSGALHNEIARLNADGTLDSGFNPGVNSSISSVALQSNGKILLGGQFSQVNGSITGTVARLNADGSLDPAFQPAGYGNVYCLALQANGKILLGGYLTYYVNGSPRSGIVRLNSDGSLDTSFNAGVDTHVMALALQTDGKILLGGDFAVVDGAVRNYAGRVKTDGSLDAAFAPGAGIPKLLGLALQSNVDKVVVGGDFISAGGGLANALARLRSDGRLDPTFISPFNPGDKVQTLQRRAADSAIIASALVPDSSSSGASSGSSGRPRAVPGHSEPAIETSQHLIQPHAQTKIKNPIKQCSPIDGSFDAAFNPNAGTSGVAYCLSLQPGDGKIVVGGNFALLNGAAGHPNIGRLDANGYLDASFAPTTDGTVQAVLAQPDGRIVLGGIFTQVNGAARGRLARLLADGSLDPGFNPFAGTDGPVAALKLQSDGRLVVVGTFANANGTPRANLARLNADGTLDAGFNPTVSLTSGGTVLVSSVDQQADGKLVIAGLFDRVNGVVRNKVARLFPDGTLDTAYDPGAGPDAVVRAIALQPDGKTLLGGDFTTVDNTERNAAARLLGDYDLNAYPALGQWRILNFGNPSNAGKAADTAAPFGDGVVNLLKFALNLNAQAADATPMLPAGSRGLPLVARDAQGRLTLTFVRRQNGTAPGISYAVEFADGLTPSSGGFAVNPAATVGQPVAIDATWERVTVTDSVPMSAQSRRFVRLRVAEAGQ